MTEGHEAADMGNTTTLGSADRIADLEQQVSDLQQEVESLVDALTTRQLIGWVTGLLGGSLGLTSGQAWSLLAKLSQHTNVKVREVARVLSAAYSGDITDTDQALADQLAALLDGSWQYLVSFGPAGHTATHQPSQQLS